MGQKCCSASENTPEIQIGQQESTNPQKSPSVSPAPQGERGKGKEQMEKRRFYGKDGQVHSRTITKDMAVPIDLNFDQYRLKILKQPSTIREQTNQSIDSAEIKRSRKAESSHCTDVIQNFLDGLAEEVSNKV